MGNLTYKVWWPGCDYVSSMSDFDGGCGEPCFSAELVKEVQDFNLANDAALVSYPSRGGGVTLRGWWLPAPGNGSAAPRIVVQHGFRENSNHYRWIVHAYMLRSLGFSVLVNNLRDHGYSDDSPEHINFWGDDAYVNDLLGAWDFAVNDPDGVLGGSLPTSQVGMLGASMGGFVLLNAFGQEGRVPAMWADGAFLLPKIVFTYGAENRMAEMGIGFLGPLMIESVWSVVEKEASDIGVRWSKNLPEASLRAGPDTARPVHLAANWDDEAIPQTGDNSQHGQILGLFQSMPSKYTVAGVYTDSGSCHEEEHTVDHLRHFPAYRDRACRFWRPAFGLDVAACDALP